MACWSVIAAAELDVAMLRCLIRFGDLRAVLSRGGRCHFKAFKQPLLVGLKIARQDSPLGRSRNTIAVNDLAQDRFIDTNGFSKPILVTASAENLKFEVRKHSALFLCLERTNDLSFPLN